MELLLLISIGLVVYTYLGYGLIVWLLIRLRPKKQLVLNQSGDFLPDVTLVIPAYNERTCLSDKVANSLGQLYPRERIRYLFVTEGSTDGSDTWLHTHFGDSVDILGGTERRGKVAAINRAMQQVTTPIVVFTDANTQLNPEAIQNIARHFQDPMVGAVAGEKRILTARDELAAGSGEGLYWKYESQLKRWDAELYTIVGAAGELFAIRTELYEPMSPDTILDDFMLSLRIAERGYRVAYEPEAYALERPSFSIIDEQKRKIRIAAGGFQSMVWLTSLLNPFRHGWLTFEYVSHRVMRWAVTPFCLPLIILLNGLIVLRDGWSSPWGLVLAAQIAFYGAALAGYILEKRQLRLKAVFVPFYFTFMNGCALAGWVRYLRGKQSGTWEQVRRAKPIDALT